MKKSTAHTCAWRVSLGYRSTGGEETGDKCTTCQSELLEPFFQLSDWEDSDRRKIRWAETGFFLKCNISYSDEARKVLAAYPPLAVHKTLDEETVSQQQKKDYEKLTGRKFVESTKLVASVEDVKGVVLHHRHAHWLAVLGI